MLCGATYRWQVGSSSWAAETRRSELERESTRAEHEPHASATERWRQIDGRLRRIAKHRAALDHEELSLIREAIRLAIWRELGMTSIREYLERVMGYSPVVASERVRVAEALDAMPALERALATGELPYSAVREITRIATRKTEAGWAAACVGLNLRQIEDLLAEREPGDRPDSPRNPDLRMRDLRFKVRPATEAAVRLARQQLEAERGERLDPDELLNALAQRVLSGEGARSHAATQVAVTVCAACGIVRQSAAGRDIALRPEEVDQALCDAEWIDVEGKRRARQDITPAVRKAVRLRDGDRCRVPGCRAANNIDVHHIVHRALGGSHDPENLLLLCSGHHGAHHRGELTITGTAMSAVFKMVAELAALNEAASRSSADLHVETARSDFHVETAGSHCHGERPSSDFHGEGARSALHGECEPADVDVKSGRLGAAVSTPMPPLMNAELHQARADAVLALKTLGFTRFESVTAVDAALAQGNPHSLEELLRCALQRCPRPTS